jgi:hypothetical protein
MSCIQSGTTEYVLNHGSDSSFAGNKTAQGNQDSNNKGDFYYEPPSGFLALCTDNLSDPSIADPTDHFNTMLWTGNSTARSITGLGFQPDLVWAKSRDGYSHQLADSVLGAGKTLSSDTDAAQSATNDRITAFEADGFALGTSGNVNNTPTRYCAWSWKAGGDDASNTDGTITSSVSANPTAGFSIVKYAGNNTSGATVGHGLSETPELIIIKNTEATVDWIVYSEPVGPTKGLQLNGTGAAYDYLAYFNDTSPTASVFSLGNYSGVNANTEDMIAYCFHSVEGYSKVGSYTGNLNADGPFAYTGFSPAWIMFKPNAGTDWTICDNKRNTYNAVADRTLNANLNSAEHDGSMDFDFLSNGFKIRNANSDNNHSVSIIYLAFAESPFKTSNAR